MEEVKNTVVLEGFAFDNMGRFNFNIKSVISTNGTDQVIIFKTMNEIAKTTERLVKEGYSNVTLENVEVQNGTSES